MSLYPNIKNKSDEELIHQYLEFKNRGVRNFASWWGYNLTVQELKRRNIYRDIIIP